MTHHINKLYVMKTIHIVESSIEMHENYARNKPRAVSSRENPVRANRGKPIALLLVPGLIPVSSDGR